jgi:hypothetical protein
MSKFSKKDVNAAKDLEKSLAMCGFKEEVASWGGLTFSDDICELDDKLHLATIIGVSDYGFSSKEVHRLLGEIASSEGVVKFNEVYLTPGGISIPILKK